MTFNSRKEFNFLQDRISQEVLNELSMVFESRSLPLYGMMSYHFGFTEEFKTDYPVSHGVSFLTLLDIFGLAWENALPAAAALELVNGFCLIHDDIESGQPQRDGRDALWWIWGPAQAINAGDGMHALARMTALKMIEKGHSSEITYQLINILDKGGLTACEGRFRDLEMQERLDVSTDSYNSMAVDRSGALISASLVMAGLVAGKNENELESLEKCGKYIGLANHISSDMEQLWGMTEENNLEFLNKKKLFPVVLAMQFAGPSEKRQLGDVYFKRVLEKDDLAKVLGTIENLGVKQKSLDRIEELINSAEQCLASVGLNTSEVHQLMAVTCTKVG